MDLNARSPPRSQIGAICSIQLSPGIGVSGEVCTGRVGGNDESFGIEANDRSSSSGNQSYRGQQQRRGREQTVPRNGV
jgi:hypothetical protein